jgi:hypothetical protein
MQAYTYMRKNKTQKDIPQANPKHQRALIFFRNSPQTLIYVISVARMTLTVEKNEAERATQL